jgi:DNA-binding NarL/FixJ family response regulator
MTVEIGAINEHEDGARRRITILLADDHPVVLLGVRHTLEQDGGFTVVAEARNGPEVVPLVGQCNPDVVLLDLHMPGLDGLGALDRIRSHHPDVKVVMFSSASSMEQIEAAFRHGASGFVVKSVDARDLASAIRQAVQGTAYHALGLPALTKESVAKAAGLTGRELDIVQAVADGLSNKEIAQKLWVTEQTVKFHLTNVYRKLDIPNRTGLTRWVLSKGLQETASSDGHRP